MLLIVIVILVNTYNYTSRLTLILSYLFQLTSYSVTGLVNMSCFFIKKQITEILQLLPV